MDSNDSDCNSAGVCCRSNDCAVRPQFISLEHAITLVYHERIWRVIWDERAQRLTVYMVSEDLYGNLIVYKKIKTINSTDPDFEEVTDGNALLRIAVKLVEKFSTKTAGPQYFSGVK